VGGEEGEEDNRYPEFLQSYVADFCFVGGEVGCEGFRPDFRAEVAGHADEGACKDKSLCEESVMSTPIKQLTYL